MLETIDSNKPLPEVKRRIRALLKDIQDSDIHIDRMIVNNRHRIHFTLRNKDYALTGDIYKKVTSLKVL